MIPFALPPAETRLPVSALIRSLLPIPSKFPTKFGTYLGVGGCVLANSARSLLYLLLRGLSGQAHSCSAREVLIPGYTCYSVAAAVVKAGFRVALYDLDPHTFQPDFDDVRRKIKPATLAVVGQHLLGVQSDIKKLTDIAHENGICCIEDSAQYLAAGQFGDNHPMVADFVLFSFGRGKPLPLGGGGALITRNRKMIFQVSKELKSTPPQSINRLLPFAVRIFSWRRMYWILERLPLGLGRTIYDTKFTVSPMSSLHQRIGDSTLPGLDRLDRHRVNISRIYCAYFGGNAKDVVPHVRFPLSVGNQSQVCNVAKLGVRKLYPLALCDLPDLGDNLIGEGNSLHGAREIASHLISLPTHMSVDTKIAETICRELVATFRGIRLVM